MNETTVTVVGNLVDDPRLRQIENGTVVASFRVASTSRRYDRDAGRWVDSGSLFLNVTCWRALGENVAASLRKGDPALVVGRLFTRTYERDGQLRSSYDVEATAVGPDLARGTAAFQRQTRVTVPPTFTVDDADGDGDGEGEGEGEVGGGGAGAGAGAGAGGAGAAGGAVAGRADGGSTAAAVVDPQEVGTVEEGGVPVGSEPSAVPAQADRLRPELSAAR